MAKNTQTIRIESINGGKSVYSDTANADQYQNSIGIDITQAGPTVVFPSLPYEISTSTVLGGPPLWIKNSPKDNNTYLYDMNGSIYAMTGVLPAISALGDLNDGGGSRGNGCAYYDNYMYFARNTTVARYGPLNGTPSFTDDYWITTLGKTVLEDQATPDLDDTSLPNHVMHRHKDGKLYFADTLAGQGLIHYIKTSKTTIEGDTDNGSKYNALDLPYGYIVTDIESYGDDLIISAFEGRSVLNTNGVYGTSAYTEGRSALFFWDTVAENPYKVIQNEFPDQMITALENANGVIYTFSQDITLGNGLRICRYLGGDSFEQISILQDTASPSAGGTLSRLNQVLFAGVNNVYIHPNSYSKPCVWSIGTQGQPLSNSVFCIAGARTSAFSNGSMYALGQADGGSPWRTGVFYAYSAVTTSATVEEFGGLTSNWDTDISGGLNATLFSQVYKIGSRFKITKVKIFSLNEIGVFSQCDLRVHIVKDSYGVDLYSFPAIDNNSYPDLNGAVILKPVGVICEYSFQIILEWRGTYPASVYLPIEIEYEIINDD